MLEQDGPSENTMAPPWSSPDAYIVSDLHRLFVAIQPRERQCISYGIVKPRRGVTTTIRQTLAAGEREAVCRFFRRHRPTFGGPTGQVRDA